MPNTEPKYIRDAYNNSYNGANKYYKLMNRHGSTYHADKHCKHLNGKEVERIESHDVWSHANTCDHCTVESPELTRAVEKTKYR